MKKILSFLLLICVLTNYTSAQTKKINIDNMSVKINYRDIPKRSYPLFFYYTKKVTASPSTNRFLNRAPIWDKLNIPHQRHAEDYNNPPVYITIDLYFGDIQVRKSEIVERKTEREIDGERVVSYSYALEMEYSMPVVLTETNHKISRSHTDTIISKMDRYKYVTDAFPTPRSLMRYHDEEYGYIQNRLATQVADDAIYKADSKLRSWYNFQAMTKKDILKTMNEKKHLENRTMQLRVTELYHILQSMTHDKGIQKEQVQYLINYFEDIPNRYTDPKLKADKQIRYMAYFNLAKIFLYLEEPDKVIEYANALDDNEHDTRAAKNLIKEANKLKEVLNSTSIKTRHFDPYMLFDELFY